MDTSDSEHFESADEFHSDSESSEDTGDKSVLDNLDNDLEKRLGNLNIDENLGNISAKQSENSVSNNASILGDIEGNRTNEIKVKNDYKDNPIIPKRITDININSLVETQVADTPNQDVLVNRRLVDQDIPAQNRTEKQHKSECEIVTLKKHSTESSSEKANDDQSQESETENMWDNNEWEPISIDNVNPSVGKNIKTVSLPEKTIEENLWENDDWEPIENKGDDSDDTWQKEEWDPIENKIAVSSQAKDTSNDTTWGGWSTWGVSSILSTATHSVSTLTNQVSQGLSNVLENSMGIPNPEELAKQHLNEEEKICGILENVEQNSAVEEDSKDKNYNGFGFGNLSNFVSGVSNLTKFVEHTGNKVINGGLDTLETIGKKTMEVLQEGDPGLKNKRAFLKLDQDKPVLSQVLKEAKAKAEEENRALQQKNISKKLNYESLFDDYHGLVHLEALEMLSKQCDIKLESLSGACAGDALKEILETLEQVRELCELPDEDDEDQSTLEEIEEKIESALKEINIKITYDKGISTWKEAENWLNSLQLDICDDTEIHQKALQVLAQLTAIAVEQFHKAGELLLIKEHRSTADEADSLVLLTTALTSLIGFAAGKFSEKLNARASGTLNKEKINDLITNVFFEFLHDFTGSQQQFIYTRCISTIDTCTSSRCCINKITMKMSFYYTTSRFSSEICFRFKHLIIVL
ncbi:unnamed protein product [Phaedon cochleariae]|uniref:Protein FAM114A2 n=1 Tax=Phaedon cochleariae TaxID=80249 RepID=A0A9N9SIZ8_PHACE|nr:unnamed protein product [Phaedon cochleariae]